MFLLTKLWSLKPVQQFPWYRFTLLCYTALWRKKQIHENAIEQIARMYQEKLFVDTPVLDQTGQIRMDDWELREDVQSEIEAFWEKLYAHEITDFSYIDEYWVAFRQLFGFDLPNIDYSKDVNPNVAIPSIKIKQKAVLF